MAVHIVIWLQNDMCLSHAVNRTCQRRRSCQVAQCEGVECCLWASVMRIQICHWCCEQSSRTAVLLEAPCAAHRQSRTASHARLCAASSLRSSRSNQDPRFHNAKLPVISLTAAGEAEPGPSYMPGSTPFAQAAQQPSHSLSDSGPALGFRSPQRSISLGKSLPHFSSDDAGGR